MGPPAGFSVVLRSGPANTECVDAVAVYEAPNEEVAMKIALHRGEVFTRETLVATPLEEAEKLVD